MTQKTKKRFKVPNTYVIVMMFIIAAAILTYVMPAGQYATVKDAAGKSLIDPNSFTFVENTPVSIGDFLMSIPEGMTKGQATIFLVFLVGGFFQIINDTGAIDLAINSSIDKLKNRALVVIPIIMIAMGLLGAMGIVVNAVVAFIPIGVALAKKLKIDPIVGVSIMYLSAYAGFATSPMSAFTSLLGQSIAGLPPMSAAGFRFVVLAILNIITIMYVYRYSVKVIKDPSKSVYEEIVWEESTERFSEGHKFGLSHIIVLLSLVIGFVVYGYGTYKLSWGLNHLSAMMLAVALVSGLAVRMKLDDMAKSFVKGAQSMVFGALVIGFASAITIVLTEGSVIHSIIYYLTIPLTKVGSTLSAIGMFIANLLFNVVVPSGSGQAMIVMPLMAPMADVVGVTRQVAVLAYQYGDGFSNIIIPTSGVLMAVLGVAKIPYEKWVKFVAPLFLIWVAVGIVAVTVAVMIGLA